MQIRCLALRAHTRIVCGPPQKKFPHPCTSSCLSQELNNQNQQQLVLLGCRELYHCNMVEWFWWDSSLISTTNWFPSVLWHCWFGHLACKKRDEQQSVAVIQSVPRTRTELARRAFSVVASCTWNSLPSDIRSCRTVQTFKRHLKTHLFTRT